MVYSIDIKLRRADGADRADGAVGDKVAVGVDRTDVAAICIL